MVKIAINNISEARAAGKKYGVDFPAGRGRPPMYQLSNAIIAAGDTITPTDYFSGEFKPRVPAAPVGEAEYQLVRTVMVPFQNAKTGKEGKRPKTEKVTLTVGKIRELTQGTGLRGRVSESRVIQAFAKHLGVAESDLNDASVVRVVTAVAAEARPIRVKPVPKAVAKPMAKPVVKAAPKVAKPVAPKATAKPAAKPRKPKPVVAAETASKVVTPPVEVPATGERKDLVEMDASLMRPA